MAVLVGERARGRAEGEVAATTEEKMPGEEPAVGAPLEELGVQPVSPSSSKDENAATSVKIPQAVAPAATVPDLEPDPKLQRARQSRSEENTSELQSLMRLSYAVFCLKKKTKI